MSKRSALVKHQGCHLVVVFNDEAGVVGISRVSNTTHISRWILQWVRNGRLALDALALSVKERVPKKIREDLLECD